MFGFPVNLFDGGLTPVKLTSDANNGFPKIERKEIFYSVKDGLWSDPTTWETTSGRVGLFPNSNDDVYIRNEVELNLANLFCNNLYVSKFAVLNTGGFFNKQIYIFGDLKSSGNIKATTNFCQLNLYGIDNYINSFSGTAGYLTIQYARLGDQPIMNLLLDITIGGSGVKYLKENTIIRSYNTSGTFDAKEFDLTINGTTNLQSSRFTKTGPGKLTFIGNVSFTNNAQFVLSGNPSVEFRGGISASGSFSIFDSGSTEWAFTTNNQIISSTWFESNYINCPIILKDGITLTIETNVFLCLNNTIDSTTSAAKVVNKGNIVYGTLTSVSSFLTCQFDFTTFANTIQYKGNYTTTIPSYFSTFHNLTIAGTGTKSLGVNTTLNGSLFLNGAISSVLYGNLECSIYNLIVNGTTFFQCGGLYKSGIGNLLFVGNFQSVAGYNTNRISLSGNPNVEFRGGINTGNYDWNGGWDTGIGDWTFTTNNQSFVAPFSYAANSTCRFIVSGNITITYTGGNNHLFANKINGTTAFSTWINQGTMNFIGSEITPMATGVFDYLTSTNSIIAYLTNGSYNLPYTTYQSLRIEGTGTKSLIGNTTINKDLSMINNISRSLECSIYDLSVLGITGINGTISKTGAGNILFVGNVIFGGPGGEGSTGTFNFSGNPNVEFRGGITAGTYGTYQSFNSGTGQWKFSTNNQTYQFGSVLNTFNITCSILIDGAITLSILNKLTSVYFPFTNTINGNNANSKLLVLTNAIIYYNAATQPMATGILDTFTNLNTWIYGNMNQDIKGGPTTGAKQVYRNLTLNGLGIKTLQGFVSVLNTYTLTAPATLVNNGFTLTNP